MDIKELFKRLGIDAEIPESFIEISKRDNLDGSFAEKNFIMAIQEKYDIFCDEYLELVLNGAQALKMNEDLFHLAKILVTYLLEHTDKTERNSAVSAIPEFFGTPEGDMFFTVISLPLVESTVQNYRARGFSEEEIKKNLKCLNTVIMIGGWELSKPVSRKLYFSWNLNYMCCSIFDCGVFNFEIAHYPNYSMLLKNKKTEEYAIMMVSPRMHKSGYLLGNLCHTDEEGAYGPDFVETDSSFTGYLANNGKAVNKLVTLDKSEWEAALRPGDPTVAIHIPRKTDLTPDVVEESLIEGFKKAKRYYPEHKANFMTCHSWLLSIELYDYLNEDSKILKFGELFERYPLKSQGRDCLKFLFPKECASLSELEERTSLQAKVKANFLNGGFMYSAGGILTDGKYYK
jgi:hypothetical protein